MENKHISITINFGFGAYVLFLAFIWVLYDLMGG